MDTSLFYRNQQDSNNNLNESSSSMPLVKRHKYNGFPNESLSNINPETFTSDAFFNGYFSYPPPSAYENALQNIMFNNNPLTSNIRPGPPSYATNVITHLNPSNKTLILPYLTIYLYHTNYLIILII